MGSFYEVPLRLFEKDVFQTLAEEEEDDAASGLTPLQGGGGGLINQGFY